jgi:perosamine synthetase
MFEPRVSPGAAHRVETVLRGRWIGQGPLVGELERGLARVAGARHVVAVNGSAGALRIALAISGVGPGDEVITTPMACTMTNLPILEQGATPVFADVVYETGNVDPADVERRIGPRTRALLCAHWGGSPCQLSDLGEIASRHGLDLLADASEAFGARYRGEPVTSLPRFSAWSFQAVQTPTTAEGGALVARDGADAAEARRRRWYGIDREGRTPDDAGYYDFDIDRPGWGYHLTDVAAAIGLANLETLPGDLQRRRRLAALYRERLASVPGLRLLEPRPDAEPAHHLFTVHAERRADLVRRLREARIEASIVHRRNDVYSVFGGRRRDLPQLDRFEASYVNLPVHPGLEPHQVERVAATIRAGW